MKTRKTLSLALALALCLGLTVPAFAAEEEEFDIREGWVLLKYNGPGGDVVIPDGVALFSWAFKDCTSLTSVTIPDSATSISSGAFEGCTSLTSVTIPDSVTEIGDDAFEGCTSLTSVTIPDRVTRIWNDAFKGCTSLTSVTIPDSVTHIENEAFKRCTGLTDVTIGNGVTHIGNEAFLGCSSLTSVTIPDSVTYIGTEAFLGCSSLTSVTIPSSVTYMYSAFSGCSSLTDVTIGNGVTTIMDWTFSSCDSLTSVTIPASVTAIEDGAFSFCDSLTTIRGAEGSYAQLWALDNGYAFEAVLPAVTTPGMTAYPSTQKVDVDGKSIEFQCYALKDANGNDTNYIKLRDLADILNGSAAQFEVGWNGQVTITTGTAYTPNGSEQKTPFSGQRAYKEVTAQTLVNGEAKDLAAFTLTDDNGGGYTYYKLRDLGEALGIKVDWSKERGIYIETK